MKYILDNKSDSIKSITEENISGLEVKTTTENVVGAKKVLIVDEKLKDLYIKQKINKKLLMIIEKMKYILESDETGDTDIAIVLGEIERLKGIMINKYKEHLIASEYKEMLKRILLTEEEFKNKYNARQIYKEMLMENFEDNKSKGR